MSYKPNPIKQLFHSARRTTAKTWLSAMPALQIAITGSQGKTNTSSTLFHILSQIGPTVRTDLNLDTTYNVPITALKVKPSTKYAIFELGVDRPKEMDLHLEIVKPKIAIITGISPVHTDEEHFGSFENLIKEKQKLIEALPKDGYAVLNGDDEHVRAMAPHTKAHVIFYGRGENNDIQAKEIRISLEGTAFTINIKSAGVEPLGIPTARIRPSAAESTGGKKGDTGPAFLSLQTSLVGKHHIYNIMATFAVYQILGFTDFNRFQQILTDLQPLPGRMSVEKGPLGTTILNDSLRANPASTASGLQTLSEIEYPRGKKIAILAEMGELAYPEEEHRKIGELIKTLGIDIFIGIGPLHKFSTQSTLHSPITNPQSPVAIWVPDVFAAAKELETRIKPGDLIYLKGSLLRHVERVLMILNKEEINCHAVICPFYNHCPVCKYRATGFREK